MRINTLFYCIWQGIRNIFKNKWFTLASVATISACLFLFGLFFSILTNFQHVVKNAEKGVCVSALLEADLTDERVQELQTMIGARTEVSELVYVSAEETWQQFAEENDFLYDEIGSELKIRQIQREKAELLQSLESYYKVFFLGEELYGADTTDR